MIPKVPKATLTVPLLALGSLVSPALAQEAAKPAAAELPAVTVTGEAQQDGRVPVERVQRNVSFDMKDIFRDVPGVSVGGGARNAQRIYLDGVEGTNLNVTIDGARQGRGLFQHRGGMTGMDPDLLKRVEVESLGGADGGPGALGGTIRLRTVDAQDLLEEGRTTGARLKAGYASADSSKRGSLTAYGLAGGSVGLLAHASGTNHGDYRIGGGWHVPQSAGQDRDFLLKLSLLDMQGHSLRLGAAHTRTAGLYARGSTGSDAGYYPPGGNATGTYYQRLQRTSYTLEYGYEPAGAALTWSARLYRNENQLAYPGAQPAIADIATDENGFAASGTWRHASGALRNQLTFGLDGFQEKANGTRLRAMAPVPDTVRSYLDGSGFVDTSRNLGLFVQNRLNWSAVTLSLGARHDDYAADYGPKRISGSRLSPHARIDVELAAGLTAHAGYAEAVRASGIVPVGFLGRIHPGTATPAGGLAPETSQRKEVGLGYDQGGVFAQGDRFGASVRYFDTRLKNMIDVPGQGSVPADRLFNQAPLQAKGWALGASWRLRGYATSLAFTHVDVARDGQPVGVVRRDAAGQGDRLVWDHRWQPSPTVTLGYTLEAVSRLKDVPANEPERAGYVLHGLQGEWRPAGVKGLGVKLALHNLFDKRYAAHTTLYGGATAGIVEEPGRDIRLELEYRF